MQANETIPPTETTQVATTKLDDGLAVPASPDALYTPEGPDPKGTRPKAVAEMEHQTPSPADAEAGLGIEGEEVVWEAFYAMKNFIGRLTFRTLLTIGWVGLAAYTWGYGHNNLTVLTSLFGVALLLLWLALAYRILLARCGHYYRLTNRRLFVSTGLLRRRRDQMELLRVKDVFTRQTLFERWLSLGTVVVVSDDYDLPTFYLTGVHDPRKVMDLVWHYARAERDLRSVRVDRV
jgi:membrane protein YdbS with pleckstrin-like domain